MNSEELLEMGNQCLRSLVEKFDEKLIPESLDYFELKLKGANDAETIGICSGLFQMVDASRMSALFSFKSRISHMISNLFTHDNEQVRYLCALIFKSLITILQNEEFIDDFIRLFFLKKIRTLLFETEDEEQAETDLENFSETMTTIIGFNSKIEIHNVFIKLCLQNHEEFTAEKAYLIKFVAPVICNDAFGNEYVQVIKTLYDSLLNESVHVEDMSTFKAQNQDYTLQVEQNDIT
jgi:hypothetical protein